MNVCLRVLLCLTAGLVAAIAFDLAIYQHVFVLPFALLGWSFSLPNAAVGAAMLYYRRPLKQVVAVSALLLLPYPVVQYFSAASSVDRGVVMELSVLVVGAYLCSAIVMIVVMIARPLLLRA